MSLMVRDGRHVRAHRRNRVNEARAVLDLQPLDGIGVVACPALRHVVEYARIEASPTAGAAFEEDFRVSLHQFLHHGVKPENIAVGGFALAVLRQSAAVDFCQVTVHVPFDVIDRHLIQNSAHLVEDRIPDFFAAEIENQLVTAQRPLAPRNLQRPIRMRREQFAHFGNHFRFEPETELHPLPVRIIGDAL